MKFGAWDLSVLTSAELVELHRLILIQNELNLKGEEE